MVDPAAAAPAAPSDLPRRWTRYTCGSSISVGNTRDAGTLGCLLRNRRGELFGLSANHVTGGCSNANPGAPIVAPGIKDVGAGQPDPRTVGYHDRSGPFVAGNPGIVDPTANTDAAVFKLVDPGETSSWQGGYHDTPMDVGDPIENAVVEKVGRTTRLTRGYIDSQVVGPSAVAYKTTVWHSSEEAVDFRGTVYFDPVFLLRGRGRPFAARGDSGALVTQLSADGNSQLAVGILFSGRDGASSLMLPLRPVLDNLEMTLVSGHIPPEDAR